MKNVMLTLKHKDEAVGVEVKVDSDMVSRFEKVCNDFNCVITKCGETETIQYPFILGSKVYKDWYRFIGGACTSYN